MIVVAVVQPELNQYSDGLLSIYLSIIYYQIGVLYVQPDKLFVSDTLNHKIKLIDLKTNTTQSLYGGAAGILSKTSSISSYFVLLSLLSLLAVSILSTIPMSSPSLPPSSSQLN